MPTTEMYQRRERIPWQEAQGHALVLNTPAGKVHELNPTAAWVWQRLEKPLSWEQLCREFIEAHDCPLKKFQARNRP